MKKYSNILFIVILIFLIDAFISCKKNSAVPPVSLIGTWNWIKTQNGYPYFVDSTPTNTGIVHLLIFKSDNSWIMLRNNIFNDSGTYSLGHNTPSTSDRAYTYTYDSVVLYKKNVKTSWTPYKIFGNDTLILSFSFAGYAGGNAIWYTKQ